MARGNIRRVTLPSGKTVYKARIDIPNWPGKRISPQRTFERLRDAQSWLHQMQGQILTGQAVKSNQLTTGHVLAEWLAQHSCQPTTRRLYSAAIARHISPRLGHLPIQQLTTAAITRHYRELTTSGIGTRIHQQIHQTLHLAIKYAIRAGYLGHDPTMNIPRPQHTTQRRDPWTPEELRRYLEAARSATYWPAWLLLPALGGRRGEILGLRWSDLDLVRGEAHIRQSAVQDGSSMRIKTTKNPQSRRSVHLTPTIIAELIEHRERQRAARTQAAVWTDLDLVIANEHGRPVTGRNLYRVHKRITRAADLSHRSIHDLRHAHASYALAAGVPLPDVSAALGHANPHVTAQIYAHATRTAHIRVAAAVEAMITAQNDPAPSEP